MEINLALIKAVQKHPILYNKTGTLEERKVIWKKLQYEFATRVRWLKARWDWLLQSFCDKPEFKYANDMSYLLPYFGIEGVEKRCEWPFAILRSLDTMVEYDSDSSDEGEMDSDGFRIKRGYRNNVICQKEAKDDVNYFKIVEKEVSVRVLQCNNSDNKQLKLMDTAKVNKDKETFDANKEEVESEDVESEEAESEEVESEEVESDEVESEEVESEEDDSDENELFDTSSSSEEEIIDV
ncbi:probable serine/threonine-protein kinase DDB_G0268642 [Teleopsis dalmanni]|uniref:probable serine/threonine-protein kinase DDB_G0268642 n=1 Tax=Teleopsis dalmanni TaxID=139649 RepID=UPI0018CFC8FA|nr:probable serine/threonine-protein kinase DDB_G0268642 [Teleopsis dalmanni]